jgi:hypothetical protein
MWPPRSPDLTSPDFFLWGFLKDRVYANKPRMLRDLKDNILAEIGNITEETLQQVTANMKTRVEACLETADIFNTCSDHGTTCKLL